MILRTLWTQVKSSGKLQLGILLLVALVVLALLHPVAAYAVGSQASGPETNPLAIAAYQPWLRPSPLHWLGTERYGRDVLVMALTGLATSLVIGLIAGFLSTAIGVVIAFVAGYKGGRTNRVLVTVMDVFLVVPTLPLLLTLSAYMRKVSLWQVALLLAIFSWPFAARTIRAHVLSLRSRPYVDLARVTNCSDAEIIFQDLVPNLMPYIGVGFANAAVAAVAALVALEVIGLGPANTIDLGLMISFAVNWGALSLGAWPLFVVPIVLLTLLFMSVMMINIGLEEVYNPRLRSVAGA
jgi:peptide/nickel transport system permease protein